MVFRVLVSLATCVIMVSTSLSDSVGVKLLIKQLLTVGYQVRPLFSIEEAAERCQLFACYLSDAGQITSLQ